MSLEELYYISQIVAVVAIFGSLVYVAIQTRQNGRMMRAKAAWDAQTSFIEINDMLASGGTMSQLSFKWLSAPESLTDYEKYLSHRFMRAVFQRGEAQFALHTNGVLDAEVWHLRRAYIKSLLSNPIGRDVWQADKANSMFTRAFIADIDGSEAKESPAFLGVRRTEPAGREPA